MAAEHLNDSVNQLVEREFPRSAQQAEHISWSFQGPVQQRRSSSLTPLFRHRKPLAFTLDVYEPPGSIYTGVQADPVAIELLANADGLLFLMDPLDPEVDAYLHYFNESIRQLHTRLASAGELRHGKLPHHVAVCITKFDDERFFRRLVTSTDLVVQDRDGARLPRIPQQRSNEFFDWVCEHFLGGHATLLRETLKAYLNNDRIAYFAISSIGFRLNKNGLFDFRDFNNVEITNGTSKIRNVPRPNPWTGTTHLP